MTAPCSASVADATGLDLRLRRLVTNELHIGNEALSLVDDLAVDSLDLLELALRIEETFDIGLPDRLLATVRTYGDLLALVVDRVRYPTSVAGEPVVVRALITPPPSLPQRATLRVMVLTPYAAELISEDARRMGHGTCVEMTVPDGSGEPVLAGLRATFAHLADGGIDVQVDRDERWRTDGAHAQLPGAPRRRDGESSPVPLHVVKGSKR